MNFETHYFLVYQVFLIYEAVVLKLLGGFSSTPHASSNSHLYVMQDLLLNKF